MDTIFEQDKHMMTLINGLEKGEQTFLLGVDNPTHVFQATFEKDEMDNFVLKYSLPEGIDFDPSYFFVKPAVLSVEGQINIVLMNTDFVSISETLYEKGPRQVKVIYRSFSTEVNSATWKQSKHCAYYKYSKQDFRLSQMSLVYDFTTEKDQMNGWRNAFVISLSDKDNVLVSFEELMEGDDAYCIFHAQNNMDIVLFDKIVKAVRLLIGLLSGYLFGDRAYYISNYSTTPPKDRIPLIIRYRNMSKPLKHKYPILDSRYYQDIEKEKLKMNTSQFNILVKLLVENEEFARAVRLLIDASSTEGSSRGVLAVVALETIANIIAKKGAEARIIHDKSVASQLIYELEIGLKKIKGKIDPDDYIKLESKVNSINSLPNALKLESAFEQTGIMLDDEEQYCLSCRNRFLHGTLPKNTKLSFLTQDELIFMISHRLIMLTTMLLLKKAGYDGLVNDWGYSEVIKRRAIRQGKPLRHTGNAHRKV